MAADWCMNMGSVLRINYSNGNKQEQMIMAKDIMCGMTVDPKTAIQAQKNDQMHYFCSEHCRKKLLSSGKERESKALAQQAVHSYICPMHPEIQQDHPGDCPQCGMALEPMNATENDDGEKQEIKKLSRKFWVGLVFGLPVVILALEEMIPTFKLGFISHKASEWIQLILATLVIFWSGGFFYIKAWKSIINRSLNMFTLIAVGVSAAYFYSVAAVFISTNFF